MVKQMQQQAMSVIQEQMQNQFKAAMQAAKGRVDAAAMKIGQAIYNTQSNQEEQPTQEEQPENNEEEKKE